MKSTPKWLIVLAIALVGLVGLIGDWGLAIHFGLHMMLAVVVVIGLGLVCLDIRKGDR